MKLNSEHQTHVHHIFYALCKERSWALGLPSSFNFEYLPDDYTKIQARIEFGKVPTILIHPDAFTQDNKYLVKGLIHHELCHFILGLEVGHGPEFVEFEQYWDEYWLYKEASNQFARWLSRRGTHRITLICGNCGGIYTRNRLPVTRIACRKCCNTHSEGKYDENYALHIGGATHTKI